VRFFGEVGYGEAVEEPEGSGNWKDMITVRSYSGDVIRNTRQLTEGAGVVGNITVSNSIAIVSDQYAVENYLKIKYVRWDGNLWTVTDVEVRRPRLILSLGGVYNGPTI
jgi:hypothetical protein